MMAMILFFFQDGRGIRHGRSISPRGSVARIVVDASKSKGQRLFQSHMLWQRSALAINTRRLPKRK
jgi:hypothetical protein